MVVKSGYKPIPPGPGSAPLSAREKVRVQSVALTALSLFAAWLLGVSYSDLAFSVISGLVIGWIRTAWSIRNRLGESFISALFGTTWNTEHRLETTLDLSLRGFVGFSVGLTFATLAGMSSTPGGALSVVLGGAGSGGGDGPGILALLIALTFIAAIFALVGLIAALAMNTVQSNLLQSLQDKATAGAAKALAKDAGITALDRGKARSRAAVALQGVVTALLTALLHRIFLGPIAP